MQTATNPDTGEKVVLIGSEWKPFTQSATNSQGVKAFLVNNQWMTGEGMPKQRQGVDQFGIPITIKPTEPEAPLTLREKISGAIETPAALAANLVSGPITYLAGAGGPEFQRSVASQIQYQPRTRVAQQALESVGKGLEATKLPPFMPMMGGATNALAPATRAIGDAARAEGSLVKGAVNQQLAARAAKTQEANVAASYANAPMIEGTQAAHRLGAAVNPAISNPTLSNRARGAIAGPAIIEEKLATSNAVAVTNKVREDLGVPANKPLDASAINTALDNADKPNDIVRKMAMLVPDADVIKSIEALEKPASAVAKGKVEASNALINNMLKEIKQGRSGADVLNDIRQLRAEANNVYKRRDKGLNVPTDAEIAEANTRTGIAKAYEQLIDANVKDPNVLGDIKLARTRQAQIFDHERALDYGQQKVDPQAYAKMYEERQGKNMTGVGQDIALAASTHPSVFTLTPAIEGKLPRFSRAGLGGLIGGTVGSAAGPVGTAVGLAAGTGIGSVAGGLAARRMGTPAYQAARAVPKDYRPAQNMLRPVEPNYAPNQMVPYDYSQSIVMPGETPNFVFGRPEAQVNVGTQYAPNQLPAPSAEGTLGAVAAERARAAGMSRTMGTQAEAQQAAAEAAARQPTGRGSVLEFDPITGTYKVGGAGVKGATPEVFMRDTGASLKSATEKLASNQPFKLDAAEKVAWDKTKVDLAEAAPELKGLTDKAIASKMMDREWIADTIQKIKDKALANEQIAARASTAKAIREAAIEREKLNGNLEMLQEQFSKSRPVQKGGQGPKTRAFQRNMLTPEQEILNALAK